MNIVRCPLCRLAYSDKDKAEIAMHMRFIHNAENFDPSQLVREAVAATKSHSSAIDQKRSKVEGRTEREKANEAVHDTPAELERKNHRVLRESAAHKCRECGLTTSSRRYLKQHRYRYHDARPCPECGYVAAGKRRLDAHVKKEHRVLDDASEAKCALCDAAFDRQRELMEHILKTHVQAGQTDAS